MTNRFIECKIINLINPNDEFAIFECRDAMAHRVLEFMVSILYLKTFEFTKIAKNFIKKNLGTNDQIDHQ